MSRPSAATANFTTIRDWLRYGVTSFSRAKLTYGHGTSSPLDEAAFLILVALDLPIDQLEPWLDARLTPDECVQIEALIARRIATRLPAPYLVNAAFIQGRRFYVDERVIVPRAYIGELICDPHHAASFVDAIKDRSTGLDVLELCTGSGCLAILAAEAYADATIDAIDLSRDALVVAARNVADYGLATRIKLIESDLFASLPARKRYDLIIANPPYVAAAEVAAFDPEYRAEPVMAHLGGTDGLDLVRRILDGAKARLKPHGTLVVEIGTGRDLLEHAYPDIDFIWLDTATSEGEVFLLSRDALKG